MNNRRVFDHIKKRILPWLSDNDHIVSVLLLVVIAVLSHVAWFLPGNHLFAFDTMLYSDDMIRSFGTAGLQTFSGFLNLGDPNIQIYFNLPFYIWGFFGSEYGQQIARLIPVALLSVLAPYYLLRHIVRSSAIAFVGALFFAFATPHIVRQNTQLFIAFINALAPLLLLLLIRLKEKPTVYRSIVFGLFFALGMAYELRMMAIVSLVLALYFCIVIEWRRWLKLIPYLFISVIVAGVASLFWILPTLQIDFSYITQLTDRPVFGTHFFPITRAFTLAHPWWHWLNGLKPFTEQTIRWFMWLIPVLIFSPLLLSSWWQRKRATRRHVIFFLVLALLGVFLSKQNNAPLPGLYNLLYTHAPIFNLFRVGSKFYLLTMLGYIGLFGYIAQWLSEKHKENGRVLWYAYMGVFVCISFFNAIPLITQRAELFHQKEIPEKVLHIDEYIKEDEGFSRTFWIPWEYEGTYFTSEKPIVRLNGSFLQKYGTFGMYDSGLQDLYAQSEKHIQSIFNFTAIKRIIVQPSKDLFWFKERWFSKYHVRNLSGLSFLEEKKIMDEQTFYVFENRSSTPITYLTSENPQMSPTTTIEFVEHTTYLPTRVDIRMRNVQEKKFLHLAYKPFPEWEARVGSFTWEEALFDKGVLLEKVESYPFLNTWVVDPEKIKQTPDVMTIHEDGSIDIDLTIYYRPEAYYLFGARVSLYFLGIVLLYLCVAPICLFAKKRFSSSI